jgi:ABC-type nitrate/sulfonate/bicarbonate transport system substrate-binding protein
LDVSVKTFGSGTAASEAFRAGNASFVTTGDLPAIKFWQVGDTVGLASVEKDSDLMVMAATKDIKSPADLKGKKVATRMKSTGEFMTMKYLSTGNVSAKDITLVNMSPADMVIALDRGDISAFFIWQPYGWQAKQVSRDKVHLMATNLINEYMMLSTSKKFAGENPGTVVKTLKALDAASQFIKKTSPQEIAGLLRPYARAKKDLIVRMLPSMKLQLNDGKVFRRDMNALAKFMIAKGSLKRPIDWKKDYNDSFLKKVKPALFK